MQENTVESLLKICQCWINEIASTYDKYYYYSLSLTINIPACDVDSAV